jgi:hypothetical protein
VHLSPAYAGSGERSDHFRSYVHSPLHSYKRLFPWPEPMTSWGHKATFTCLWYIVMIKMPGVYKYIAELFLQRTHVPDFLKLVQRLVQFSNCCIESWCNYMWSYWITSCDFYYHPGKTLMVSNCVVAQKSLYSGKYFAISFTIDWYRSVQIFIVSQCMQRLPQLAECLGLKGSVGCWLVANVYNMDVPPIHSYILNMISRVDMSWLYIN